MFDLPVYMNVPVIIKITYSHVDIVAQSFNGISWTPAASLSGKTFSSHDSTRAMPQSRP